MATPFEETRIKSWAEAKQRLIDWGVAMGYNKEGIIYGSEINPKLREQLPKWLGDAIDIFAPQEAGEIAAAVVPVGPVTKGVKAGAKGSIGLEKIDYSKLLEHAQAKTAVKDAEYRGGRFIKLLGGKEFSGLNPNAQKIIKQMYEDGEFSAGGKYSGFSVNAQKELW